MKTIKYILATTILCGLFFTFTHAGRTIEVANAQKPLLERIADTELKYGIKKDVLKNVAYCESRLQNEGRYGDHGLAYGIFQFHRATFDLFVKLSGIEGLAYLNGDDQLELAGWAFSHGYEDHWSCYLMKYNHQKPLIVLSNRI